ncbi:hypothetical protein [Egicoccus sp. AB-alg6-2]|uniref:hypothetical protein n=1 Tax=Egicoccus sp. AB-alg6-2 TaxID=3242692 RepID=UPI00359DC769
MEPDSSLESRLSPAAQLALQELLEDVRAEILARAGSKAAGAGEITATDIIASAEATQRRPELRRESIIGRILSLYAGLGVVTAVAALAFGFADSFTMPVTLIATTGLTLALVAAFATAYMQLKRSRRLLWSIEPSGRESPFLATAHFLNAWNDLEAMSREKVALSLGESKAGEPLSRIVAYLASMKVLAEEDTASFKSLLELRNAIVHGNQEPDPALLIGSIKRIEDLRNRLSRSLA